jgi:hypothetical protein
MGDAGVIVICREGASSRTMARSVKKGPFVDAAEREKKPKTVDVGPDDERGGKAGKHSRRAEKVGFLAADKMEKTSVVRVDRLIKNPKYRRRVPRKSKFMAHDEKGLEARAAEFKPDTTGRVVKPSPAETRLGAERIKKAVRSVVKDS